MSQNKTITTEKKYGARITLEFIFIGLEINNLNLPILKCIQELRNKEDRRQKLSCSVFATLLHLGMSEMRMMGDIKI
jgi:hypothetical protein